MYHFFLLLFFKGLSSAHVQPKQVVAHAGRNVILPCSLKIPTSHDVPTVEWSKEGLKPDVVFLYRDGCETFEMKNEDFEYRSNLVMREVKNGNVSLRISNVKLSDAGTYQCLRLRRNGTREATKVELLVGCFSASPTSEKLVAFSGGNAILPCSLNIPGSDDLPTVEWSKEGLKPNVVFLFRNGFETFKMKNPAFEFRTSLFMREVKNGNVSLRISNVRPSDGGKYQCLIIHRNGTREATEVHLVVAAVSDPMLSVDSVENQRVTVACEATCWLPAPLMVIMDEKGNNITDTVEIRGADPTKCYTVRQTATVPSSTHRVVCRVDQQQTDQSRTAEILISAQWTSSSLRIAAFSAELIASVCFFGLCVFCVWWACWKYAEKRTETQRISSDHQLTGVTCEGRRLLKQPSMTDGADNTANETIENLRTQVADLRSEICKKDETILKLWGKIQSMAAVNQQDRRRRSLPSSLDYPQHFRPSDQNMENGELLNKRVAKQGSVKQGSVKHLNPVNLSKWNSLKHEGQNQSSDLGPGHGKLKNVRNHSSPSVLFSSTSAAVVNRNEKTDFSPRKDPRNNPGQNGRSVHRRHSLGVPPSFQSRNSYIPLPHLAE